MKVTVKPLKGDTFEVEYEPDDLVKALKAKIESMKPDMPAEQLKLIYSGKILADENPLKEYNMKEGDFLVVMVAKAKPAAKAAPATAAAPAPATTPAPAAAPGTDATPATAEAPDAAMQAASAMPTTNAGMNAQVEQLMAMGFEKEQVENCLRAAFGNADRAVEYLMSGIPEGITAEMNAARAPAPGGAPGTGPPATGAPPATGGGGGAAPGGGFAGGAFPAMPTGGGGGTPMADLPPALAELRNSPQFAQLAQVVAANPGQLQQMLPALAAANPAAAQAVQDNPEIFMRMLAEAAGGGGGGGGGGSPMGGAGGMAGMGGMPQSPQMAQMMGMMAQNPEMLQQLVGEIAQSDPELAAQIQNDPQGFARAMQAMGAGGAGGGGPPGAGGAGGGGPGGGQPQVVRLTEEEGQAVERLMGITGMDRQMVAQAYLACDKNEELACNFLFDQGADD